jgi:5-methylthioadenosine/S-adenosylhomocysteine deaminase
MTPQEEQVSRGFRASVAFNSAIAARRGPLTAPTSSSARAVLMTLGTDNMAEDMIEVMRTALFMERVRRADGQQPTPEEILVWATRNAIGARHPRRRLARAGHIAPT